MLAGDLLALLRSQLASVGGAVATDFAVDAGFLAFQVRGFAGGQLAAFYALRDAGLDVSQDGLNFSLRQQNDNNQSAGNSNRRGSSRSFSLSATAGVDATTMTAAYRGPANGRLDIRV